MSQKRKHLTLEVKANIVSIQSCTSGIFDVRINNILISVILKEEALKIAQENHFKVSEQIDCIVSVVNTSKYARFIDFQ